VLLEGREIFDFDNARLFADCTLLAFIEMFCITLYKLFDFSSMLLVL